jgi:hypothetical protein
MKFITKSSLSLSILMVTFLSMAVSCSNNDDGLQLAPLTPVQQRLMALTEGHRHY